MFFLTVVILLDKIVLVSSMLAYAPSIIPALDFNNIMPTITQH